MRQENLGETIANSVTHGVGVALSIAGTALILTIATLRGGARDIVSASIYGATLVLLYVASTLYHALPGPRVRHVFRILDHSSIYLLIAGTYTPFTLVSLRGGFGWSLFGIIWGLAIGGVVFKSLWVDRLPGLSTTIYVLMGWLALVGIQPLYHSVSGPGFLWLVAGGVCYTGGVAFFCANRMRYAHAVWHVFVLAGSACHYCAVYFYVLPHGV
ncbi:MAG TPA: hemolysin III family protein [Candidatus Acidoferrum sp.]|jgi:hemolysin III|nr:hemolysin III family protein [Candidatus Acidoferrum sp.]HET9803798.1 hemolysin III family protein [Candidatus Acidoferrum sp.]